MEKPLDSTIALGKIDPIGIFADEGGGPLDCLSLFPLQRIQ